MEHTERYLGNFGYWEAGSLPASLFKGEGLRVCTTMLMIYKELQGLVQKYMGSWKILVDGERVAIAKC